MIRNAVEMIRRLRNLLTFTLALTALILTSLPPIAAQQRPYSVQDLKKLAQGGVSERRMLDLVKQRGIAFTSTAEVLDELRRSGVPKLVLTHIRELTPAKPPEKKEPVPTQPQKAPEPWQIVVQTSPNAEVYLDDQYLGRASPQGRLMIGSLKAGEYGLRVSLTGKRDYEQTVTVVAGQVANVAASLADLPGRVVVRTAPGARVFLNDYSRGVAGTTGELVIEAVAPGTYDVRISAPGKRDYRQSITVAAGQEAKVEATLEDVAPTAGAVKENPKDGLKYVWIPPGTFMMGCSPDRECDSDEKPVHEVTITKGFWIGQTEVTQVAYQRVTGRNPTKFRGERLPVEWVFWGDAGDYCKAVGMRLPTEAEWEYAARAGSRAARYGDVNAVAWHAGNSGDRTHEVAQKQPNAWGLYDTLGNVWEMVRDAYDTKYYDRTPTQDPPGPLAGDSTVLRGGAYTDIDWYIRVSDRSEMALGAEFITGGPPGRFKNVGFRCAGQIP